MPRRMRFGPPRVTKGGDGGRPVPAYAEHGGSYYHDRDNELRVLVGRDLGAGLSRRGRRSARDPFELGLLETADPFDCAHADRHENGRYLAQAGRRGDPRDGLFDRPRRAYPTCLMVGRPGEAVSHDSQWDAAHEREKRLGISLGVSAESVSGGVLIELLVGRHGRDMVRAMVQPRTHTDMSPRELALERRASAMLGEV